MGTVELSSREPNILYWGSDRPKKGDPSADGPSSPTASEWLDAGAHSQLKLEKKSKGNPLQACPEVFGEIREWTHPSPTSGITAVFLKHVNQRYHTLNLLDEFLEHGVLKHGEFDLFFVPIDRKNRQRAHFLRSSGHAFLNFTSPHLVNIFKGRVQDHKFQYSTISPMEVWNSSIQGLHSFVRYFWNQSILEIPYSVYRPLIFMNAQCISMPLRQRPNPEGAEDSKYSPPCPPKPSPRSLTKYADHYDRLDQANSEVLLTELGLLFA